MSNPFDLLGNESAFDQLSRAQRHSMRKHGRHSGIEDVPTGPGGPGGPDEDTALRQLNIDTGKRLEAYYQRGALENTDAAWLNMPELPTEYEISSINLHGEIESQSIQLNENKLTGEYDSAESYLETQYRLLREDAVSTLRDAVEDMVPSPYQMENQSLKKIRIYNRVSPGNPPTIERIEVSRRVTPREKLLTYSQVYIKGLTFATEGIAHKLEFHTDRVDKRIAWSQSKRLKAGTLVALSPAEPKAEVFQHHCIVGIVAARALADVEAEVPCIDVYFADPAAMEIDPQVEYTMIEASNGYFEAVRHTLLALQHMRGERFPLAEHLVRCERDIDAPVSLKETPHIDIGPALLGELKRSVNIIDEWPEVLHSDSPVAPGPASAPVLNSMPTTSLDRSQFEALRRILTKRLAIIQGPPGTGKTHVSVVALQILLANRKHGDAPIVVTAQTNHALDQLLRHIAPHAPNFVRLGGQTQDQEVILPRTLFKVKDAAPSAHRELRKSRGATFRAYQDIAKRLREILAPLISSDPIDPKHFLKEGLISGSQYNSLVEAKANWVGATNQGADSPFGRWTNGDVKAFVKKEPYRDAGEITLEDDDEDLYQKKDIELEAGVVEDDKDTLWGEKITISDGYLADRSEADRKVEAILRKYDDLDDVPAARRGPVYNYLQRKLKEKLLPKFREIAAHAKTSARRVKITRSQLDAAFVRDAPIIGLTTTGLSKYRGLVSSLCPKIVLIEEAAETQEAYVTAACFETLEQLILVGDHLQLQAHCQNQELENWNLHISLFERLVHYHNVEFQQLTTQRRMLPEMREVMNVIYPNLSDHSCVLDRKDIPGMNGVNSWFMTHKTIESVDEQLSWVNQEEAELVAGLYDYLIRNGTASKDITILTFYRGQQRKLRQVLRNSIAHDVGKIQVSTVDAYQGEENEIVILSLVRNNERGSIGFLNIVNRVCVAMSRARRGFYIFGNAHLLVESNEKWNRMLRLMRRRRRVGIYLPITCSNHHKTTKIEGAAHWLNCDGGCDKPCREVLVCGHTCPSYCHPESHDDLACLQDCIRELPCGHPCSSRCCDVCACKTCAANAAQFRRKRLEAPADEEFPSDHSASAMAVATVTEAEVVSATKVVDNSDSELYLETGSGNAWEAPGYLEKNLISLESDKTKYKRAQEAPSLAPDSSKSSLSEAAAGWAGRPVANGWEEEDKRQRGPSTSGSVIRQNKQASVKAYQNYAKGGVVTDDRRRADESAEAAMQVAKQVKELGVRGDLHFGSAVPLQMTSRVVQSVSPPKSALSMRPSDTRQPLQRHSGTGPASRASPNTALPVRPRPDPLLDPFIKERSGRYDAKDPNSQDSWQSGAGSGVGVDGIQRPGHQQPKLATIDSLPMGSEQGAHNLAQARSHDNVAVDGAAEPEDVIDSSPHPGGRKKWTYTFTPKLQPSNNDQNKADGDVGHNEANSDKVLHAGKGKASDGADADSTKVDNSPKTSGNLIDL